MDVSNMLVYNQIFFYPTEFNVDYEINETPDANNTNVNIVPSEKKSVIFIDVGNHNMELYF